MVDAAYYLPDTTPYYLLSVMLPGVSCRKILVYGKALLVCGSGMYAKPQDCCGASMSLMVPRVSCHTIFSRPQAFVVQGCKAAGLLLWRGGYGYRKACAN